jgi:hypothetical protein
LLLLAVALGACGGYGSGSAPRALRDPFAVTAFDSNRGVTVLFGGLDGSRAGETWDFDGTTWTLRATTGPSPRQGHAMAFDSGPGRNVTVLFGGFEGDGKYSGETWEWDGATWTLRTSTGPDPRYGHAMAYDSVRGSIFLFGGYHVPPDPNTWEYTGSNGRWFLRSTSGPSPRVHHAMVFDVAHHVTLLFGGQDTNPVDGPFASDLWQWEAQPRRWTQILATGPGARYLHNMTYDSARGVVLLFGGLQSDYTYAGDTWAWDGVAWTQESTPTEPSPRASHAMAFDSARGVAVLFGGYDGAFNRETWEWDGSQWTERDASFSTPIVPSWSWRGFLLLDGGTGGIRSLRFRLDADAAGMHAGWMGEPPAAPVREPAQTR